MQSARKKLSALSAACCTAVVAVCLLAGSAQAAVYPPGGGAFNGGLEGWTMPVKPTCNIPLMGLCTTTAGYDGEGGNPAGSLVANTTILVNLGGVFKATAAFQSPNFKAGEGGAATLHVDRELASGNLLDLAPQATYVVTLIDRSTGTSSEAIADSVAAANTAFTGKDGAATLIAGHTYAISIDAETSSSVANVGLLGSSALRFDNVALTVGTRAAAVVAVPTVEMAVVLVPAMAPTVFPTAACSRCCARVAAARRSSKAIASSSSVPVRPRSVAAAGSRSRAC